MDSTTIARSDANAQTAKPERRPELDLLRGLVVLALIPYHTATYFIAGAWAPRRYAPSPVAMVLIYFSTLVAMPLMFFISGMGARYSLQKRTARVFVGERVLRLVVPFVVGLLLLVPPIQYYGFKRSPLFEETFAQFYPTFFHVTPRWSFPPGLVGPRYLPHHLWFLKDLFVYTLVLLPLLAWLGSDAGRRVVTRLAALFARPWAILLFALPTVVIEATLGSEGAWNRFSYILFLFYGYLIVSDARFAEALRRQWKSALLVGLGLFLTLGIAGIFQFLAAGIDFQTDPGLQSVLFRLLKGFVAWCLIVGFMGWAARTRPSPARRQPEGGAQQPSLIDRAGRYLSQSALPIYVLHLTFVVVIGFYVVQWTSSMLARFLLISIIATLDTLAAYDLMRRTPLTRFLFGMRWRGTTPAPAEAQPAPRRGISVGDWVRANRPHLLLLAVAVVSSLSIIWVGSHTRTVVGKWEQTSDSAQAASGYLVEFKADGTWVVTLGEESLAGTYTLTADDHMEFSYPDGRRTRPGYRLSADRFALIDEDGARTQVFFRIQ